LGPGAIRSAQNPRSSANIRWSGPYGARTLSTPTEQLEIRASGPTRAGRLTPTSSRYAYRFWRYARGVGGYMAYPPSLVAAAQVRRGHGAAPAPHPLPPHSRFKFESPALPFPFLLPPASERGGIRGALAMSVALGSDPATAARL
jgi:hypothetical protein